MISIIIPVYNAEAYLPQCLDSILIQTYQDFEIILINDGSSDNSETICNEYALKDSRIHVIHQKNAGVSTARNNGIEHAQGKWITFIDSDDWIEPSYLANFKLDESTNIDLIIQGLEYYDHRKKCFFNPWSFKECILHKKDYLAGFTENRLMEVGFPIGKAYQKKILNLNNLRFDSRISFHEDHIFVLDYYRFCNTVRLVNATDYKYRCYHTTATLSSKRHPWNEMNLAGDEMLARFEVMKGIFFPKHSDTERSLYTFAYDCKITAAESIILGEMPYKEKQKFFKQVIHREQIERYYYPVSIRNKITKYLYLRFPYIIAYVYLHLIQTIRKLK